MAAVKFDRNTRNSGRFENFGKLKESRKLRDAHRFSGEISCRVREKDLNNLAFYESLKEIHTVDYPHVKPLRKKRKKRWPNISQSEFDSATNQAPYVQWRIYQ